MALWCTKTSSPSSRDMKPKPFSLLNHLTVPCATLPLLARRANADQPPAPSPSAARAYHTHKLPGKRTYGSRSGHDLRDGKLDYVGRSSFLQERDQHVDVRLLDDRFDRVVVSGRQLGDRRCFHRRQDVELALQWFFVYVHLHGHPPARGLHIYADDVSSVYLRAC